MKNLSSVSSKKIDQLQAQINLLQSEIDLLRGDFVEFESTEEAKQYFEKNF